MECEPPTLTRCGVSSLGEAWQSSLAAPTHQAGPVEGTGQIMFELSYHIVPCFLITSTSSFPPSYVLFPSGERMERTGLA